jgi:hypothetical protein
MRWVLVLGLAVPAIAQDECGACAEVRKSLDGLCADDAAGRLQALTAIREAYPHAVLAIPTLFEVMEDDDARVRAAALATIEALGARGLAVYVSTFGSGSAWETAATTFADLYRRNNDLTFPEYFAVFEAPRPRDARRADMLLGCILVHIEDDDAAFARLVALAHDGDVGDLAAPAAALTGWAHVAETRPVAKETLDAAFREPAPRPGAEQTFAKAIRLRLRPLRDPVPQPTPAEELGRLLDELRSDSPWIEPGVVDGCRRFGAEASEAVPLLEKRLAATTQVRVRVQIARALVAVAPERRPDVQPILEAAARNEHASPAVLALAVRGLCECGSPAAEDALVALCGNEAVGDADRRRVIDALAGSRSEKAHALLASFATSDDLRLRYLAARSLRLSANGR